MAGEDLIECRLWVGLWSQKIPMSARGCLAVSFVTAWHCFFWRWAGEGLASPSRVALITLVSCSSAERGVGASVVAGSTSAVIAGLIQTSTINSVRAKVVGGVGLVPSPRIKGVSFDQGWHRIGVPRDWCKCKIMLSSNAFIVVVALIMDWMFTLKWGDSR